MLVYQRVFPHSNVSSFRHSSLPAACSRGAPGVTSGDPGETEPGGLRTAMVKRWLKDGEMMIWLVVWNKFYFSVYWEESSQLTNSMIFQRGRSTTNQLINGDEFSDS